jgi:hypothetical protein
VGGTPPALKERVVTDLVAHPADGYAISLGEHTGIRHK